MNRIASYSLLLSIFTLVTDSVLGCSVAYDNSDLRLLERTTAKIFIGKAIERKIIRDSIGEIKETHIRFTPLKVRKGEISLSEYFWFPTKKANLAVVVGETYEVYASAENKIDFGYYHCSPGTGSMGKLSPAELDAIILEWRLLDARKSDSRSELMWAKEYITKKLLVISDEKRKRIWEIELDAIEERLSTVF